MKKYFSVLFSALAFSACRPDNPLENSRMDLESWKKDENGCQSQRNSLLPSLDTLQTALAGLSEPQVRAGLGKPDEVELFKKNQKFYIYYLEKGGQCDPRSGLIKGKTLSIRFDALNHVNEVFVVPAKP